MPQKVAIVAALEREVKPVIRNWHCEKRTFQGYPFKFFENDRAVLVCGGIGPEAARRAAQAIISLFAPSMLISLGFAGALDSTLKVGDTFVPQRVVDAGDSSVSETGVGSGTLVSFASIAGMRQKEMLAKAYGAQAVDMEAAAVGRAAQTHGIPYSVLKAVSDERDFEMPDLARFIRDGQLSIPRFMAWAALRPWLWPTVIRLARTSNRAARTLRAWLEQYNRNPEKFDEPQAGLHLITK